MVATKPHMIKAALLTALPVHCPIQLPTLPDRTAWGCVCVCPCMGLEVARCTPAPSLLLERFLEAPKSSFVWND